MASPLLLISLSIFLSILHPLNGGSPDCIALYEQGSAPAVLMSPDCSQRNLAVDFSSQFRSSHTECHVAVNQGRRPSMEDRAFCALGHRIPFHDIDHDNGNMVMKEIDVGIIAVFDGHNGAEASEMASNLFGEYFLLHSYFVSESRYHAAFKRWKEKFMNIEEEIHHGQPEDYLYDHRIGFRQPILAANISEDWSHLDILKESLLRAVHDIDSTFSKMAFINDLKSGSTAALVLIADGQILAANVGDSKAFLCSEDSNADRRQIALDRRERRKKMHNLSSNNQVVDSDNGTKLRSRVKELTHDHHPDRVDERSRIEAAGGYVTEWAGVVRVNGQLAISRSIGDVLYKQYGVVPMPEVADWQPISGNDTFLVATSDGVLEKLTTQEACDIVLHNRGRMNTKGVSDLASLLLAEAVEKGTRDNVAAVVVPLYQFVRAGTVVLEK